MTHLMFCFYVYVILAMSGTCHSVKAQMLCLYGRVSQHSTDAALAWYVSQHMCHRTDAEQMLHSIAVAWQSVTAQTLHLHGKVSEFSVCRQYQLLPFSKCVYAPVRRWCTLMVAVDWTGVRLMFLPGQVSKVVRYRLRPSQVKTVGCHLGNLSSAQPRYLVLCTTQLPFQQSMLSPVMSRQQGFRHRLRPSQVRVCPFSVKAVRLSGADR
jgi:hypothetical protein